MGEEYKKEFRAKLDCDLMNALDMIAMSKGQGWNVTRLVVTVLSQYVATKQHQASLLSKLPAINPLPADSQWSDEL